MRLLNKSLITTLGIFLSLNLIVHSQITSSGKPFIKPGIDTFQIPEYSYNLKKILLEKASKEKLDFKNDVFAVSLEVSINPDKDGIWIEMPEKQKRVWLLKIKVEQSISLNLILNPFRLNEGTKLFFYDSLQTRIIGAITYRNNKPYEILPLSIIKSNIVYCEMQVPEYIESYGNFTISNIGAEPEKLTSLKSPEDEWYGSSRECNVNVACVQDGNIKNQKNAVCRIIYSGTGRCTGTLLNNLENDGKPYIITAAHCINTQYIANTAVFYFGYESPVCENMDGPIKSVSGATLVSSGNHIYANYDTLDFALLLLDDFIPLEYVPYYSGWDATGTTPDSIYVIHHPMGDIKKISLDNEHPKTGSAGYEFDPNTHWLIENYRSGTTEQGSSGSSLMDEKHRVIGVLTLGLEPCTSTPINDLYQKFSHCYNDYSDSTYQLKHWLDPKNTNKLVCNSYDVAGIFKNMAGKLSNYIPYSELNNTMQNNGWGYSSGHNYRGNSLFAEKFYINGSKYLYGANFDPSVVYTNNTEKKIVFNIWEGEEIPEKIIYQKSITLSDIDEDNPYYIDFDSTVLVSGNFYAGYQIFYNSDTFALRTYACQESENTAFTYLNNWKPLQYNSQNQSGHLAIELLTFDLMPEKGIRPDSADWSDIYIYPNPVKDQVQIYFKKVTTGKVDCKIYDAVGRLVFEQVYYNPEQNIPIQLQIETGIYFLQVVVNSEKQKSFQLLVR